MTAANPSHALALVLTDELVRCGVTDAVLAPGSRSTALAMALHDEPRIRLHVEIDERSAGFLAVGYARAAGRPAAVVTTSGTATANLHPAVVEADTGDVPLLVLTADRPPEDRNTGSNQTIDQLRLYGGAVRWFCELGVPEDRPGAVTYWRSSVSRAVAQARGLGGPPGPVHLNLAFREPTVPATDDGRSRAEHPFRQELHGRSGGRPWTDVTRARRTVDDGDLAVLAGRIAGTERGLLLLGSGVATPAPLLELARAAGWPVIAEPVSGARSGPNVVAAAHHLLANEVFAAAHVPDLVLRVGRPGLSPPVARHLGPRVPQVLVDPHGAWHDPARSVGEILVADPGQVAEGLAAQLPAPAGSDWLEGWRTADAAARAAVDAVLDAEEDPTEPRTARDVAATVPDGGLLVVASSMPVRDLDLFMAPRDGLRVLANRGASGIDGFASTVLGAALAEVGPVTALSGDLSLLHDANGFLLSPAADRLDAVIVVVDNDGGGIFSFLPQADHPGPFERVFGTPHGRDLADLARLHGLGHTPVHRADALVPAIDAARAAGGIHLVHVRTDRAANVELHRRLQAAVDEAL